jgi:dienelactone hydrolase
MNRYTFAACGHVLLALAVTMFSGRPAEGAVKTETVKYKAGNTEFVGYVAYDDSAAGKRPGVLVAPEWIGLNDYARSRARQLAELGYVAFAMDPYGNGKNAADATEAAQMAGALKKDTKELRARAAAALETLRKNEHVDASKIAAIGYCFGGTTVLELARSGADIAGVVSFHGDLATPTPAGPGQIKAQVLALHGGDDPFVPPEVVAAFQKEMQSAGAKWELTIYGGAVHAFTNPAADGRMKGAQYNATADKRSWQQMQDFFRELFGPPTK